MFIYRLECEIEAFFDNDLKLLPENKDILLNLAKEQAQDCLFKSSQALTYQEQQVSQNIKS